MIIFASVFIGILFILMFSAAVCVVVREMNREASVPVIKLVSTLATPEVSLGPNMAFNLFLSHMKNLEVPLVGILWR